MLILNRKENEIIVLTPPGQQPIIIQILSYGRGNVRVGIDADRVVSIVRGELLDKIPTVVHEPDPKPSPFRPGRDM